MDYTIFWELACEYSSQNKPCNVFLSPELKKGHIVWSCIIWRIHFVVIDYQCISSHFPTSIQELHGCIFYLDKTESQINYKLPKGRNDSPNIDLHLDNANWHTEVICHSHYQTSVKIRSRLLNLADPIIIRLASAQHDSWIFHWWRIYKHFLWESFYWSWGLSSLVGKALVMTLQRWHVRT